MGEGGGSQGPQRPLVENRGLCIFYSRRNFKLAPFCLGNLRGMRAFQPDMKLGRWGSSWGRTQQIPINGKGGT